MNKSVSATAATIVVALVGCAKQSDPPPDIAPDVSAVASSSGSGGAGGQGGTSASSAGPGAGGSPTSTGASSVGDDPSAPGTRIRSVWYSGEDGYRGRSGGLRDSMTGESCLVLMASDGIERCMPINTYYLSLYTDPACVAPAAAAYACFKTGSRITHYGYTADQCPRLFYRVFSLGEERVADTYSLLDGECVLRNGGPVAIRDALEIPPTEFVAVTSSVEEP